MQDDTMVVIQNVSMRFIMAYKCSEFTDRKCCLDFLNYLFHTSACSKKNLGLVVLCPQANERTTA